MKRWHAIALLALLSVLAGWANPMLSEAQTEKRKLRAQLRSELVAQDRYVDLALELTPVDRDLENGEELLPGRPLVKKGTPVILGGRYDTKTRVFVGPSENPMRAFVSRDQMQLILHSKTLPAGLWVEGSMGGGKTTAGGLWVTARAIEHACRPIWSAGVTSPTFDRTEPIRRYLFGEKDEETGERKGGLWSHQIARYREGDRVATLCTGLTLEFKSAHMSSKTEGSPIQGSSYGFCLSDEEQDYFWADGDIRMRGRSAWNGRYQRLVTITLKDDPKFREFRDTQLGAQIENGLGALWHTAKMIGPDSPFIHPDFWLAAAAGMTPNEAKRKIWAEDVPSEARVYLGWDREHNLRTLPQVPRWEDVTARELARFAPPGVRFDVLVGSDPGRRVNVSVLLKAYQPPIPAATRANPKPRTPPPAWFVVGEVTTERNSVEYHVRALLKVLNDRWGCNVGGDSARAFVRMDPMAQGANDEEHPDQTVYTIFRQFGLHTKAAAYRLASDKHSWVPREARIDLVNVLLCNSLGERRLFVQCDDQKVIAAPKLVEAFERQERDGDHRAERAIKGSSTDMTHWSVALGYALWAIEKPRIDAMRGAA